MADQIKIRSAQPHEHVLLSDIAYRSKASWGYSTQFMESVREELLVCSNDISGEGVCYWVAEFCGTVVGFIAVKDNSNDACRLELLFIDPQFMRMGVGTRLVRFAKTYAKECGALALTLQSDPYAAPFYFAVGGVQVGESESDSIPGRFLPEISIPLDE